MTSTRLALAAFLVVFAGANGARADVLDAKLPPSAWTKTVGSLRVEKYGSGPKALILVPGLACGAWSWRDTIGREAGTHTVYAVTLAGFDGLPGGPDATLDGAEASLVKLIGDEHLNHPVVIGHSMGGTLALRFGIDHADLVSAVVAVDGLPVPPQLAQATPEQRAAAADQFFATVSSSSADDYAKTEARTTADFVTDPALSAKVSALILRSDQKAVAEYGKELYQTDLRPQLAKLTVPAAEIAPIPGVPLPSYLPEVMASLSMAQREAATVCFYQALLQGAPTIKVLPVDDSRHFVMLDQPGAFAATLDGFLDSLK